jgi:hypothetical protein
MSMEEKFGAFVGRCSQEVTTETQSEWLRGET